MAAYANPSTHLGGGTATRPTVFVEPRSAWFDVVDDVTANDRDFYDAHEYEINRAGVDLIRAALRNAWAARGYEMSFLNVDGAEVPGYPTYCAVRDEAASLIPFEELVEAAGLESEYGTRVISPAAKHDAAEITKTHKKATGEALPVPLALHLATVQRLRSWAPANRVA